MKTVFLLLVYCFCTFKYANCDPVVKIPLGPIQGVTIKTPLEKHVDAFLGIPYAKPPIGPNRFRLPLKIRDPWQDTLVAKDLPKSCIQGIKKFPVEAGNWFFSESAESEDCLYLNIWVPHPKPEKVAVMVWIHAGGFAVGSSNIAKYDGAILASEENVIVVSINYRLGVFGFLHLPDTDVPGNIGLFDQIEALKWIQENIAYFGGDQKKVTLFGESAGGMSISFHLVSSESKDLFHSGIIQSGPPNSVYKLFDEDLSTAKSQFIKNLHCSEESTNQAIVDCLRQVKAQDLKEQMENLRMSPVPMVDGKILRDKFGNLMLKKHFHKVNVMLGTTSEDGALFPLFFYTKAVSFRDDYRPSTKDFLHLLNEMLPSVDEAVHKTIASFYTDIHDHGDPHLIREEMAKLCTDYFLTCGTNTLAKHLSGPDRNVYLYQFTQIPSVSGFPKWMGSNHGDEIAFVFGAPLNPKNGFTKKEVKLSKKIMKYWTNFAKFGNPNGKDVTDATKKKSSHWPKYTAERKEYISLSTNLTSGNGLRLRECAFWDNVFPELLRRTPKEL